jgi:hypothetical protein
MSVIFFATMLDSTALVDVVITMDRPAFEALEKTIWGIMPTVFHPPPCPESA